MQTILKILIAGSAALLPVLAHSQEPVSRSETPAWLQQKITADEALPEHAGAFAIWQLQHHGKPAYLVISPCCDQYNPLYDEQGKLLCHPTGGIVGQGDSQCPFPADPGTPIRLVWLNPKSSVKQLDPPQLSKSQQ
ncbi:hypothetical protein HPT27_02570 [Permianibacter sp. IMCC34836]|uniref:DUF6970 domain-containing protein n=1 Tax=Permianibacter fluminis TaxID=2738515 RepID=UPI00155397AD|nr:hypothetical protein [Permianibacter fluminis]NQD35889.1 hypothetical protein [Permianibacter fluminis]